MVEIAGDDVGAPRSGASLRGVFCLCVSVVLFAGNDTLVKWLTVDYSVLQIAFFRSFFAFVPLAILLSRQGGWRALATRRPLVHLLRSLIGVVALLGFFAALEHLPLADAYALFYTAPLWLAALSGPMLGERVGLRLWLAIGVGFAGVLIMLRPGAGVISVVALLPLGSALAYAVAMGLVRRLAATETNAALMFYFMLANAVVGGIGMVPVWVTPTAEGLALLVLTGVNGGVALMFLTEAFRVGPASVVAPLEYTGMVWAVGLGWLVFGDWPEPAVLLGSAVVIGSGSVIVWHESRRHPDRSRTGPAVNPESAAVRRTPTAR